MFLEKKSVQPPKLEAFRRQSRPGPFGGFGRKANALIRAILASLKVEADVGIRAP